MLSSKAERRSPAKVPGAQTRETFHKTADTFHYATPRHRRHTTVAACAFRAWRNCRGLADAIRGILVLLFGGALIVGVGILADHVTDALAVAVAWVVFCVILWLAACSEWWES